MRGDFSCFPSPRLKPLLLARSIFKGDGDTLRDLDDLDEDVAEVDAIGRSGVIGGTPFSGFVGLQNKRHNQIQADFNVNQ